MRELRPGLWHWEAAHPESSPGEPWQPSNKVVSSYAIRRRRASAALRPLAVPSEIVERAIGREPVIVLTAPWHERDARSLVERREATVFAPRPDTPEDLMRKYGVTAEEAAPGSPDLAWLRGALERALR